MHRVNDPPFDALTATPAPRLDRRERSFVLAGVAALSCSMLAFEVLQSITLSLQVFHHNAFLVISVSLLGLGAGGSFAIVLKRVWPQADPLRSLVTCASGFALAVLICMLPASRTSNVVALILLTLVPYVFVGLFLSILFKSWPRDANRYYAADLAGAALGCLALCGVMAWLGDAAAAVVLVASGGFVAALLLCFAAGKGPRAIGLFSAGVVATLALLPAAGHLYVFHPSPDKHYAWVRSHPVIRADLVWSRWGLLGRLDMLDAVSGVRPWKNHLQDKLDQGLRLRVLYASGDNNTVAVAFRGDRKARARFALQASEGLAYAAVRPKPDVLAIGVGAGVDLFLGVENGAASVTGVEINPLMLEAMAEHSREFWDVDPFHHPTVTIHEMDGRTFANVTDRTFDLLTLSAVDTGAGLSTGGLILSENYLYTVEAFDRYLQIVRPGGIIFVRRPTLQMLRILLTAAHTLSKRGATDPGRHFVVLAGRPAESFDFDSALIFRDPASPEQLEALEGRIRAGGNWPRVAWWPGLDRQSVYAELMTLLAERSPDRVVPPGPLDISPITDDRPFFYHLEKRFLGSSAASHLMPALSTALLASIVLILGPLGLVPLQRRKASLGWTFAYFAAVGIGFMFVEIALIQRLGLFLGHPAYSLAVTLFGILLFSGAGSLTAGPLADRASSKLRWVFVAIAGLAVIQASWLTPVLMGLQFESLAARILLAIAVIAPASFLMGMPLPMKIRELSENDEAVIAWAWAINAVFSVLGSILATVIAINVGFGSVLVLGAAAYLLAMLAHVRSGGGRGELGVCVMDELPRDGHRTGASP